MFGKKEEHIQYEMTKNVQARLEPQGLIKEPALLKASISSAGLDEERKSNNKLVIMKKGKKNEKQLRTFCGFSSFVPHSLCSRCLCRHN